MQNKVTKTKLQNICCNETGRCGKFMHYEVIKQFQTGHLGWSHILRTHNVLFVLISFFNYSGNNLHFMKKNFKKTKLLLFTHFKKRIYMLKRHLLMWKVWCLYKVTKQISASLFILPPFDTKCMIFAIFWCFYCKHFLVFTAISIIANVIQFLIHYSSLYASYLRLFQIFPCWNETNWYKVIEQFQPAYPERNLVSQIILINLRLMRCCTCKLLSSVIVHSCSVHLPTPVWTLCSEGCKRVVCGGHHIVNFLWQNGLYRSAIRTWRMRALL